MPEGTVGQAQFLDIILYSKEQVQIENESMGNEDPNKDVDYQYGIVSIKAQNVAHELPMAPITAMRNSLGTEFGGSGVDIDREKYNKSVEFW